MSWKPGDRLTHRHNPDLGPGRVVALEGRTVVVEFPSQGTTLRLAAAERALIPLVFPPGARALHEPTGRQVTVAGPTEDGGYRLEDGREVLAGDLWPAPGDGSLVERLAQAELDPLDDVALRLDALHLASLRESSGLGSFLGGRIRLFPHQLYVAERAARSDPVRWLLADEVGLGKTVEACLILHHLVRTGRAERALVVAPGTLVVQWLGELWRKYHEVFVLLDDKRLADVARDFGPAFNPFDAHRRVVVALETLTATPALFRQAVSAGLDALIVDEAHHLRRPPGHPGDPAYRAVAPLAAAARHVLFLTATPLEEDAHGFFRLLQLLRPDAFPEETSFEARVASGEPLPPCTSATRRVDIGGLPPRVGVPVSLDDDAGWGSTDALVEALRQEPAPHAVARRAKADRLARALGSAAALVPVVDQPALRRLARQALDDDPRVGWLAAQAGTWKRAHDKTLVFVAHRETLEFLQGALSRRGQLRAGVFHEDMAPAQRDIEVAQFRLPSGPSLLLSTEAGGEGRNFEFCTRVLLWDLPWSPTVVEQRIGRLDRIGRDRPVEIVYFRPPRGPGTEVARVYEELGLFREPLGGIERELDGVEEALAAIVLGEPGAPVAEAVTAARAARTRVQLAAAHALHRDPYRPEMAAAILARVPGDLEELTEDVVRTACERLGFWVEEQRGRSVWEIELGNRALVESLPGVPGGSRWLGTFDREEAVRNETLDFYASGHALVEGILAHLDESPRGRTGLLPLDPDVESPGLVAVYKEGSHLRARAVDGSGRERPDWARRVLARPFRSKRLASHPWTRQPGWAATVRALADHLLDLDPTPPAMLLVVVNNKGTG
jgi:ATP-dependent helicase HepA